jgi:hypothetical protein
MVLPNESSSEPGEQPLSHHPDNIQEYKATTATAEEVPQ